MLRTILACVAVAAGVAAPAQAKLSPEEAAQLATDAYVYGYPLVTMEYTRRVLTNVVTPGAKLAPMGQLAKLRAYPSPADKEVTAPNADTLYTLAWLDVSKEPWVFGIPDMKDRYFLMPMLSGFTDVFQVPGTRTTGTKAQTYAITGPGWKGSLPKGVTRYDSPTGMVWILGRIYCTGTPEDYAAVHALQDRFTLVPLSSYGKPYTPPAGTVDPSVDMKTAVRDQVDALDATQFFTLLASLLVANPPAAADAPMVEKLTTLGISPGKPFDPAALGPDAAKALDGVPKHAQAEIMKGFETLGTRLNGWEYFTKTGVYGTAYLDRALITAVGLGANRPQDAVYPTSQADADGKPYSGASRYVLHFEAGQLPPAKAFWSITMYDASYFFVENPLNRYTLSSRDRFVENPDGSVDLYFQHESPGPDKEANWLPAPADRFVLMMRLYWPSETPPSLLDGSWKPPAVTRD